jgi:hypothetical protein
MFDNIHSSCEWGRISADANHCTTKAGVGLHQALLRSASGGADDRADWNTVWHDFFGECAQCGRDPMEGSGAFQMSAGIELVGDGIEAKHEIPLLGISPPESDRGGFEL